MLPKTQRLKRRNVAFILKKGLQTKTRFYIARFLPSRDTSSRFAVVISKKIHKSAVERNTIRRRIYETIRLQEKELKVNNQNFDCILIAKHQIQNASFQDLKKDTHKLFTQITKLHEKKLPK